MCNSRLWYAFINTSLFSVLQNITLKSGGFFYQTELLIKSIKNGYLYAEISCAIQRRLSGESKALTFKSLFKVIRGYLYTIGAIYLFDRKDRPIVSDSITALRQRQLKEIESAYSTK